MTTFPRSPLIQKAGLVLLDPDTSAVRRVIVLQYNPDSLHRTLQVQATTGEGADRSEALRLKGPPTETLKLDAEIDATDQLEFPDKNTDAVTLGVFPQLAVLESLVYPSTAQLLSAHALNAAGSTEILPMESALTLFVWSRQRVVPVRVTEFSITEEAFDVDLNPMRAKVSLGMRVLSVTDLGFEHRGGGIFMSYLGQKEQLAAKIAIGAISDLGLGTLP
jgi:hypothetical protein